MANTIIKASAHDFDFDTEDPLSAGMLYAPQLSYTNGICRVVSQSILSQSNADLAAAGFTITYVPALLKSQFTHFVKYDTTTSKAGWVKVDLVLRAVNTVLTTPRTSTQNNQVRVYVYYDYNTDNPSVTKLTKTSSFLLDVSQGWTTVSVWLEIPTPVVHEQYVAILRNTNPTDITVLWDRWNVSEQICTYD